MLAMYMRMNTHMCKNAYICMHLCLNSASPVREEGQKRERRTAEERKKNGRREKEKVVAQDALTAMIGRRVF